MSAYEDSRIVDATEDYLCVFCGCFLPRGMRHLLYDNGIVIARWHLDCAKSKQLRARCLEPKVRCQPSED